MTEPMINQLETAVQSLIEQNRELKEQVRRLSEQNENLQLEHMEKEENFTRQQQRIQHILAQLSETTA